MQSLCKLPLSLRSSRNSSKFYRTQFRSNYTEIRNSRVQEVNRLAEVQQKAIFIDRLKNGALENYESKYSSLEEANFPQEKLPQLITGAFATQLLHTESRIASLLGQGFYTIGPCGEEILGAVGLNLRKTDAVALHYRHLSTSIVRQLEAGIPIENIILDRARGYTVSSLDPVTGGRHCAIGGGEYDYLVTSTLSSQSPPAVGRAIGTQLAHFLKVPAKHPSDFVSYVSVGDGSVNNAHFLSATNLADYSNHRKYRCPVVFGISDNNICISLRGYDWLQEFLKKLRMPVFQCSGTDVLDVYATSRDAFKRARDGKRPVAIVFNRIPRRFGHAATDRQNAYYTMDEIKREEGRNPVEQLCQLAINSGVYSAEQLLELYTRIDQLIVDSFTKASSEPKITTREELIKTNSQPLTPFTPPASITIDEQKELPDVMRKQMNRVIDETLKNDPSVVYIGEDVQHGGYYLVTDGLYKKYPSRIADIVPDETSLVGLGIGYSQSGLVPIVEIPYAKYLDCGADMFFETAIMNWLSNGKAPNGMLIRLQGFDAGIFGGNFHTHNSLYTPPGVDVVCYSNGSDYVKGFRYAMQQVKKGRVVMFVDSTNLLNLRQLSQNRSWMTKYPAEDQHLTFDDVISYGSGKGLAIVTYGNGVVAALQAQQLLSEVHGKDDITVIDSPYLSSVPQGLKDKMKSFKKVVFADVCKTGQNPLSAFVAQLQNEDLLPSKWRCIGASPTYNPLGRTVTFLSVNDIVNSVLSLYPEASKSTEK